VDLVGEALEYRQHNQELQILVAAVVVNLVDLHFLPVTEHQVSLSFNIQNKEVKSYGALCTD
jgi:hypothetical protein